MTPREAHQRTTGLSDSSLVLAVPECLARCRETAAILARADRAAREPSRAPPRRQTRARRRERLHSTGSRARWLRGLRRGTLAGPCAGCSIGVGEFVADSSSPPSRGAAATEPAPARAP